MNQRRWIRKHLRDIATKVKLEHDLGLGPQLPDGSYQIPPLLDEEEEPEDE